MSTRKSKSKTFEPKVEAISPKPNNAPESQSSLQIRCAVITGLVSRFDISPKMLKERVDKFMEVLGE